MATKQQAAEEIINDLLCSVEGGRYGVDDDFDNTALAQDIKSLAEELVE